jgi:methylamine dehydrogenase accessory protein MauD
MHFASVSLDTLGLVAQVVLWGSVLLLGFLLVGVLRALALLRWRLDQLEATTPRYVGRSGLKPGTKAPDFILPSVTGKEIALRDLAGRKVLLVFLQSGCQPCQRIVPELNRLQYTSDLCVVAVNRGEVQAVQQWTRAVRADFPVLIQEGRNLSRRYEVVATPFAFLIDEQGTIASKGIISNGRHLRFLLAGASVDVPVPISS